MALMFALLSSAVIKSIRHHFRRRPDVGCWLSCCVGAPPAESFSSNSINPLRPKTVATRVTPEEPAEVETAAESAGETVAEWLRELALKAARQRPADPTELVLAEVSALRYMLLNVSDATAQTGREAKAPVCFSATRETPGGFLPALFQRFQMRCCTENLKILHKFPAQFLHTQYSRRYLQ
jgi:hypothetical protein